MWNSNATKPSWIQYKGDTKNSLLKKVFVMEVKSWEIFVEFENQMNILLFEGDWDVWVQ